MPDPLYYVNPDRNLPWNDLPLLPIHNDLFRTTEIYEMLGNAKAALARLQGQSAVIPNQGVLINTISLQEAKASSAIENIFTTDDELYKAYSDQNQETQGVSKEVLRYREALWTGHQYLLEQTGFNERYFIQVFQELKQTLMRYAQTLSIQQLNREVQDLIPDKSYTLRQEGQLLSKKN